MNTDMLLKISSLFALTAIIAFLYSAEPPQVSAESINETLIIANKDKQQVFKWIEDNKENEKVVYFLSCILADAESINNDEYMKALGRIYNIEKKYNLSESAMTLMFACQYIKPGISDREIFNEMKQCGWEISDVEFRACAVGRQRIGQRQSFVKCKLSPKSIKP